MTIYLFFGRGHAACSSAQFFLLYSRTKEIDIRGVNSPPKQGLAREWPHPLPLLRVMRQTIHTVTSTLRYTGHSGRTVGVPLVSFQLGQCLPHFSLPLKSLCRTFPVVLVPAATWLTSSWSFFRQRRSLFSDSTWASRSDLHRFSSPRIPRRPLMSFSTS